MAIDNLAKLKNNLDLLIHNPALMQRHVLNHLEEAMGGNNHQVDPTSPFMQLLEASVTSAAAAVDHQVINLSKRYPVLANTESDLYEHMSNEDYRNRFAVPAEGTFTLLMPVDALLSAVVSSDNNVYQYVSIPLDTQVEVDQTVYSLKNAIEIRVHRNNVIKVIAVPNDVNNRLDTNIMTSQILYDNDRNSLLTFEIPMVQLRKLRVVRPIMLTSTFREYIDFQETFHSVGVYHRAGGDWTKMEHSHSDQTMDLSIPKAIIQVLGQQLLVYIPPMYALNNKIGHEILIVIYSSVGAINVDYADIKKEFFTTNIDDIDNELTVSDIAFTRCSYIIYSTDHIAGGRDPLSFEELKQRTLENNVGVNVLPITPSSVVANAEDYGYTAVRHIDTLTRRVYTLSSPIPVGEDLNISTEPDVGFIELLESLDSLSEYDTVIDNDDQVTILPSTLYEVDQLNVRILSKGVSDAFLTMAPVQRVAAFNSAEYRYSPYFYVLTQSVTLDCEVYQLDVPVVDYISFLDQNRSISAYVTQTGINVTYKDGWYELTSHVEQDGELSTITVGEVYGQLSYLTTDDVRVYIEQHSVHEIETGYVITFRLTNTLEIRDNRLGLTATTETGAVGTHFIELTNDVYITYGTTTFPAGYVPTNMDDITYNPSYTRKYPLTLERVGITFGKNLTYLWKDIRPVSSAVEYVRAAEDIPMVYTDDVYYGDTTFTTNADCTISADAIHKKGDVVVVNGVVIYAYRKGDVLLDKSGNPKTLSDNAYSYYIDLFVMDGSYYSINDTLLLTHLQTVYDYIVKQSTIATLPLQGVKLEHTDLLYKPQDSLSVCEVYTSTAAKQWIDKRTFINIIIKVEDTVYNNVNARKIIEHTTYEVLNAYLRKRTISHDEIVGALKQAYQLGVISVSINPTAGAGKLTSFSVADESNRISLRKELYITPDGLVSVREDTKIDFINYAIQ